MHSPALSTTPALAVFRRATPRETAVLLAVAWVVPFAVHLVPWAGARPLGAYVLPMFWTTLVATYFYGARSGVLVGVFAPAVNLIVTGLPLLGFMATISLELAVFALVLAAGVRRWPSFVLLAPLAYIAGRLASTLATAAVGGFASGGAALQFVTSAVVGGIAGLVILCVIHAGLVWFYPKARGRSGE